VSAAAPGRAYRIEVYGCQMNLADAELLAGILEADGWQPAATAEDADLILVNTCAVREHAVERVVGHVKSLGPLKQRRPGLRIGLVGCVAQFEKERLAPRLPEVDFFVGPDAYRALPALLRRALRPQYALGADARETYADIAVRRGPGVNGWLTVMRGCDRMCAYCVVPFTRGRERSLPAASVLAAARRAVEEGRVALTLLGQTVTSYRDGATDLAGLLRALAAIEGLRRIRFLAPHPADFTPELLETIAREPKIARHLHLPVQSGSDRILEAMRRGHTRAAYLDLIRDARAAIPELALTTDILVGFPGEQAEDFAATTDLMRQVRFDSAFLFAYSPRRGTHAERRLRDDVSRAEKLRRLETVIALQEEHARERFDERRGQVLEVLVEGPARHPATDWFGRSSDLKDTVFAAPGAPPRAGEIVPVRITEATSHTLRGERVSPAGSEAR
jgi:tRNA-2-methylthio-N6-dimethylallyladenosine synthase